MSLGGRGRGRTRARRGALGCGDGGDSEPTADVSRTVTAGRDARDPVYTPVAADVAWAKAMLVRTADVPGWQRSTVPEDDNAGPAGCFHASDLRVTGDLASVEFQTDGDGARGARVFTTVAQARTYLGRIVEGFEGPCRERLLRGLRSGGGPTEWSRPAVLGDDALAYRVAAVVNGPDARAPVVFDLFAVRVDCAVAQVLFLTVLREPDERAQRSLLGTIARRGAVAARG